MQATERCPYINTNVVHMYMCMQFNTTSSYLHIYKSPDDNGYTVKPMGKQCQIFSPNSLQKISLTDREIAEYSFDSSVERSSGNLYSGHR